MARRIFANFPRRVAYVAENRATRIENCFARDGATGLLPRGKLDVIEWAMMRVINHIARIYQICHAFLTLAYIWH